MHVSTQWNWLRSAHFYHFWSNGTTTCVSWRIKFHNTTRTHLGNKDNLLETFLSTSPWAVHCDHILPGRLSLILPGCGVCKRERSRGERLTLRGNCHNFQLFYWPINKLQAIQVTAEESWTLLLWNCILLQVLLAKDREWGSCLSVDRLSLLRRYLKRDPQIVRSRQAKCWKLVECFST